MNNITIEAYLMNPCRASSLPYWKSKTTVVPESMKLVHDEEFDNCALAEYEDDPYFRLKHELDCLTEPELIDGFSLCHASTAEFARHINSCYSNIEVSAEELSSYVTHPVYAPSLWVAVKHDESGKTVATGIAELDRDIKEGIIEWIQVSEDFRGLHLGEYIVKKLLWGMRDSADFVTVSGQCENKTNPERLYRKCGFIGTDIWHILRRKCEKF